MSEKTPDCCDPNENFPKVFELIHEIDKKYEKLQRQMVKNDDLTTAQYFILRQLWASDGLQFKQLAKACNCSRSTITGVVDTMEKKGFVKRESHPNDRRSILVKLTSKGKGLEEKTPPIDSLVNNCCQGITQEDIQNLSQLLKKLSTSIII